MQGSEGYLALTWCCVEEGHSQNKPRQSSKLNLQTLSLEWKDVVPNLLHAPASPDKQCPASLDRAQDGQDLGYLTPSQVKRIQHALPVDSPMELRIAALVNPWNSDVACGQLDGVRLRFGCIGHNRLRQR